MPVTAAVAIRTQPDDVEPKPGVPGVEGERCMFCGKPVPDPGEGYYDHLRASKSCEAAWRQWREDLDKDRRGGG